MNYPTIANAITPSSWFFSLYFSKSQNDTSTPSKLEILFLLDSGAFISVFYLPTYTLLTERFLNCSSDIQHSPFKLSLLLIKPKFLFYSTLISFGTLLLTMTLGQLLYHLLLQTSNTISLALHFLNNMSNLLILKKYDSFF